MAGMAAATRKRKPSTTSTKKGRPIKKTGGTSIEGDDQQKGTSSDP
jgi:hypothetical protein